MAIDYTVRRCTRRCAATERELAPGDDFVSVLIGGGDEVTRSDYSAAAWDGPPAGAIAWWRSRMPGKGDATPAPREALLSLLDEWADRPEMASARYLLALLLVRRRVLRAQEEGFIAGLRDEEAADEPTRLRLVCRDRDDAIEVDVVPPTAAEAPGIQERLAELLGAA